MTDMRAMSDFDRIVASWLADDGLMDVRPEVIDHAIQSSLRVRPRRGAAAWFAGVRPWPRGRREGLLTPSRSLMVIALIAALVLALAALAAGMAHRGPSLAGEIEPTGPMAVAVWHPVSVALADGSVLVVGPVPDQWLHAERWDPRTGRFTVVEGLLAAHATPGSFGAVKLSDGSVLLIVSRYGGGLWGRPSGGFAVRFDPATGRFRPAGTFSSGALSESAETFAFADWPATLAPDGSVHWTPVGSDLGQPTITYDPVGDTFATGGPTGAWPVESSDDSPVVVLADGRRTLSIHWTEQRTVAAVHDAGGSLVSTFRWPLVHGGAYDGILLPDGRVLLVGDSIAIVDPDTGAFEPVDLPASFAIRGRWVDGRVLLEGPPREPYGSLGLATYAGDARPWVFDPATDSFSMLSNDPVPQLAAWVVLDDGRVLIISTDDGSEGAISARAVILR
jgi:hypothetical protein